MRLPEPSARTGYAANPLDRLSERRDDPQFLTALLEEPSTRIVVIVQDRPVLKLTDGGHDPFFTLEEARALGRSRETVLLGRGSQGAFFGLQLDDSAVVTQDAADEGAFVDTRRQIIPGRADLLIQDLRTITMQGRLPLEAIGALGQAKSLLYWHARHRFCSACGAGSELAAGGYRRECSSCRAMHFPRTDPVVIMLGVHGERCLLGRQPRFNKGMYSALAGFLEPGETIEDAVRREILEESAIRVGRVAYHASQPWPFPSSIMIGCIAEALTTDIVVDRTELEDCRWFTREDVAAMFAGEHPDGYVAPNPVAIAHHLLRAWADGQTPTF